MRRSAKLGSTPVSAAGITYLWVLLMIAVLSAGVAALAQVWTTHALREREAELLFVGEEIRRAIGAYFEATPGAARQYPRTLQDLVRDRRYPVVRRYLRRVYRDPMTGSSDWGIVQAPDGGIAGVYSRARTNTIKKQNFKPEHAAFENAATHADWKFIYAAGSAGTTGSAQPEKPRQDPAPVLVPLVPAPASAAVDPNTAAPAPPKPEPAKPPVDEKREQERRERQCQAIVRDDANSCKALRRERGEAVASRCEASSASRREVCVDTGTTIGLPALVTQ